MGYATCGLDWLVWVPGLERWDWITVRWFLILSHFVSTRPNSKLYITHNKLSFHRFGRLQKCDKCPSGEKQSFYFATSQETIYSGKQVLLLLIWRIFIGVYLKFAWLKKSKNSISRTFSCKILTMRGHFRTFWMPRYHVKWFVGISLG